MNLNEQQRKAVHHTEGPALVLAGPGSGKTTVLISRLSYLIEEVGINPLNILSMTFNKAAQREMEERSKKNFGESTSSKLRFSTLHSFCNSVVRDYEFKKQQQLVRIEGNDSEYESKHEILGKIYKDINQSSIHNDELEDLINEISFARNKMLKNLAEYESEIKNFALIYERYHSYKKRNLLLDFDDMLTYAYMILLKCPDILERYRKRYRYIQIDEGQDLSKIQFEIIRILAWPHNNLFIVADDDQSIYGFRGAEPQYILNLQEMFPEYQVYYLEQNYRSSKNIVEMSSNLIKHNAKRFDKNHHTNNPYKNDPIVVEKNDEYDQLNYLVKRIKKLHKKNITDIAILYRNNLSSITIVDMLSRCGIPFILKQNKLSFFNHWLVQDILAFLNFAIDQTDADAFQRICFKMNRYLSREMVEYALSLNSKDSLIDGIAMYQGLQGFQKQKISGIKKEFRQLAKMAPFKALRYIENEFNYFDSIKDYSECRRTSMEYLHTLFGILKTLAMECSSIPIFLGRIIELKGFFDSSTMFPHKSGITLSTIHSSKGLEYDCVFMIDLNNEEFPGTRSIEMMHNGDTGMLEEERRLFYVGLTRAREHIYILRPKTKNNAMMCRSQFIDELIQCKSQKLLNEIGEGMLVTHKYFGQGIIVSIRSHQNSASTLVIDFEGERKTLDFDTCIENGTLIF